MNVYTFDTWTTSKFRGTWDCLGNYMSIDEAWGVFVISEHQTNQCYHIWYDRYEVWLIMNCRILQYFMIFIVWLLFQEPQCAHGTKSQYIKRQYKMQDASLLVSAFKNPSRLQSLPLSKQLKPRMRSPRSNLNLHCWKLFINQNAPCVLTVPFRSWPFSD